MTERKAIVKIEFNLDVTFDAQTGILQEKLVKDLQHIPGNFVVHIVDDEHRFIPLEFLPGEVKLDGLDAALTRGHNLRKAERSYGKALKRVALMKARMRQLKAIPRFEASPSPVAESPPKPGRPPSQNADGMID